MISSSSIFKREMVISDIITPEVFGLGTYHFYEEGPGLKILWWGGGGTIFSEPKKGGHVFSRV